MKRLLFISALCLLLSMGVWAQEMSEYHPLAKEGKVWNFQSSIPIFYNERLYYSYIIKGDTIINDKKYKKLYFRHSKINLYAAALRDEGSRAYMVPAVFSR